MIEKVTGYKVGEQLFAEINEAQQAELTALLKFGKEDTQADIVRRIVEEKEKVINILTTGPKSHPTARKANGATRKPRTPKPATAPLAA